MPEKMCKTCPFRPYSKLHKDFDAVMPSINQMTESGELVGPHACHSRQTDNFFPRTPDNECAGHRKYLKDHYGTVGKLPSKVAVG